MLITVTQILLTSLAPSSLFWVYSNLREEGVRDVSNIWVTVIIIKKYLSIGYRFWLNCLNVWLNCISIRKTDNSTKCRKMRISEILEFWKRLFLKRLINVKRELSISGTREHHTDVNWTEPSLLVECRACRIVLQSKNLGFFQSFSKVFLISIQRWSTMFKNPPLG